MRWEKSILHIPLLIMKFQTLIKISATFAAADFQSFYLSAFEWRINHRAPILLHHVASFATARV
jgi:hypothetical protein